ncbi:MAG TPA: hypothetical protein PLA83_05235 [Deltaproteobacteria bacterium]|jgi:signal transduction histidine kinase|nr:hypothetical protein [Deltaproteobacteria bacterium]HQI01453.1 hypothetical protein [Deltaproteobacteria bacterium]HQJ08755.1 hypothetical protein [Deltaproteobacteria bacterium]
MSDTRTLPESESGRKTAAQVRLARAMTHELRNSLMVIGSMVRRIVRTNPEAATGETYDALMSSIERMELVLKDVDAFISTPLPVMKLQRIDDLIEAELEASNPQLQEKSIRPIISVSNPNIMAPVDAHLLRKAVSMIIREIIPSLAGGAVLHITVYDRDRDIEILFGEAASCGRLCDLYDPRLESRHWSTSLCLSTAHKIFTDHGGKMLLDPDSRTAFPILVRIPRSSF